MIEKQVHRQIKEFEIFKVDTASVDAYINWGNIKTDKKELTKANRFLHECSYYKHCNKQKGEKCEHPHCQYVTAVLGGDKLYVCGRK